MFCGLRTRFVSTIDRLKSDSTCLITMAVAAPTQYLKYTETWDIQCTGHMLTEIKGYIAISPDLIKLLPGGTELSGHIVVRSSSYMYCEDFNALSDYINLNKVDNITETHVGTLDYIVEYCC